MPNENVSNSFLSSLSRRDFLKLLGETSTGLGFVALLQACSKLSQKETLVNGINYPSLQIKEKLQQYEDFYPPRLKIADRPILIDTYEDFCSRFRGGILNPVLDYIKFLANQSLAFAFTPSQFIQNGELFSRKKILTQELIEGVGLRLDTYYLIYKNQNLPNNEKLGIPYHEGLHITRSLENLGTESSRVYEPMNLNRHPELSLKGNSYKEEIIVCDITINWLSELRKVNSIAENIVFSNIERQKHYMGQLLAPFKKELKNARESSSFLLGGSNTTMTKQKNIRIDNIEEEVQLIYSKHNINYQ